MTPGPVLALEAVRKRYGQVHALDGLSLEVHDGELLALLGPSGCGKSTALRSIAGLCGIDAGEIRIGGTLVAGSGAWLPPERRRVGIVFQDYALFPHLSVADNVAFGLNQVKRDRRARRVAEVLDLVDMGNHAGRYPHELSGGEQQRVALARALAPAPAVLLLDEPFSNLDRGLRMQVRDHTTALLHRAGATAVLVTHDQEEAMAVGDRVAVMRGGRIEQIDTADCVFHSPVNRFVAEFMGEADFLPARCRDGRLVTEIGEIARPAGILPNAQPAVMVRPHEMTFTVDEDAPARIVGAVFQGAFVLYDVRLASGQVVRSLQPHTVSCRPGMPVRVQMSHGHTPTVLIDADFVG